MDEDREASKKMRLSLTRVDGQTDEPRRRSRQPLIGCGTVYAILQGTPIPHDTRLRRKCQSHDRNSTRKRLGHDLACHWVGRLFSDRNPNLASREFLAKATSLFRIR